MEDIRAYLTEQAGACGLEITVEQGNAFQSYLEMLLQWNEKVNLTAITAPKDAAVLHFIDSLLPLKYVAPRAGSTLIDVGTGAGFPGVPMKLCVPKLKLTLLDSLQKRLAFLEALKAELGFEAELVHARAEEGGRLLALRTNFDYAAARAVAALPVLCEYCLPYLKMGGTFLAMKGPQLSQELESAKSAIRLLGCEVAQVHEYVLPGGEKRGLALITRIKPLSAEYPRHGGKIKKQSL